MLNSWHLSLNFVFWILSCNWPVSCFVSKTINLLSILWVRHADWMKSREWHGSIGNFGNHLGHLIRLYISDCRSQLSVYFIWLYFLCVSFVILADQSINKFHDRAVELNDFGKLVWKLRCITCIILLNGCFKCELNGVKLCISQWWLVVVWWIHKWDDGEYNTLNFYLYLIVTNIYEEESLIFQWNRRYS